MASWSAPTVLLAPTYRKLTTVSFVGPYGKLEDRIKAYLFDGSIIQRLAIVPILIAGLATILQIYGSVTLFRIDIGLGLLCRKNSDFLLNQS